jgi:hypothetical protein
VSRASDHGDDRPVTQVPDTIERQKRAMALSLEDIMQLIPVIVVHIDNLSCA